MRELHGPARRRVAAATGPIQWVAVALLAAAALLVVLEHDAGPWLVATTGGLATFVAVAGLVVSRASERTNRLVAEHVEGGWTAVQTELARSRRHDRRFAMVGIPDDVWCPSAVSDDRDQLAFDVADSVQGLVRRPDRAWVDGTTLHILLTDCDRSQGLAFLARAGDAMPLLFIRDRVKLVVFPDDGITLGALIASLHDGAPEPEPRTDEV